ncbi:MAG: EAL domain-containing protein, partial [Alphaproteobacteria bacterium]|nr:EAL domain-containing protein [Alphaproteobacteria bacterium]MBU1560043.1 EAL domain-containing protein [Alphaproteobacteria bacterium]
ETAALTNVEAAERFVRKARDKGCRVSLDDFGAGMSSFSYLRRFPVDSIKIDGSFIENIATSPFDREVVRSMCGIGKSLGLVVVAERIEYLETLPILTGLGVSLGQGFALHRPEPLDQLLDRISPC